MRIPAVLKRRVTCANDDYRLTGRQVARVVYLWAIARPRHRRHPGLLTLAMTPPALRGPGLRSWQFLLARQAAERAGVPSAPDNWRAAAADLRASGTIPA